MVQERGEAPFDIEAVREFFDGLAPEWDDRCEHDLGRLARVLDATDVRQGSRVLDIACGTGLLAPFYLERGAAHVEGVDLSEAMVARAREKAATAGWGGRVAFTAGDACSMELPPCDHAVVFNAIPHFADPAALAANVSRALLPGGRLTIAHDASREQIDGGHRGQASRISCGLPPASALSELIEPWFSVDRLEDDDIYVVSGTVRR